MAHVDLLSSSVKKEIDHWLKKYPSDQRRSAVVSSLLAVQEENEGHLTEDLMRAVAAYLKIPEIEVFEAASFYDMYEFAPIGKHKIGVCTNLACQLRGSEGLVDHLEKRLGARLGETTQDGLFTLRETECLAACANAPVCQVNDKNYHEDLTVEKLDALLDQLTEEAKRG
jgi:NADH-quinone oxidoreductase subunit E